MFDLARVWGRVGGEREWRDYKVSSIPGEVSVCSSVVEYGEESGRFFVCLFVFPLEHYICLPSFPWGYLAMSGDIFVFHDCEAVVGI